MREIRAETLSQERFEKYGVVYDANTLPISGGDGDHDWRSPFYTIEKGRYPMSLLTCNYREPVVEKMERHIHTPEIMLALDDDLYVPVATGEEIWDGSIEAFIVPRGTGLVFYPGVRHFLPYPRERNCNALIIFKEDTEKDDLHFERLPRPVRILP